MTKLTRMFFAGAAMGCVFTARVGDVHAAGELPAGRILNPVTVVTSQNQQYSLAMQGDGNFVLYHNPGHAIWASNTNGHPGAFAAMQGDGNLVVYSKERRPLWASGTDGRPGSSAVVQDDGNFVIYQNGRPLWASRGSGSANGNLVIGRMSGGRGVFCQCSAYVAHKVGGWPAQNAGPANGNQMGGWLQHRGWHLDSGPRPGDVAVFHRINHTALVVSSGGGRFVARGANQGGWHTDDGCRDVSDWTTSTAGVSFYRR